MEIASFWTREYFVDTVGANEKAIREYIQNQLVEDKLNNQMRMKKFISPFAGEPVKKGANKATFSSSQLKRCGWQSSIPEGAEAILCPYRAK